MEISYLKVHTFWNRYPEWMPNQLSDRGQDSNPCTHDSEIPTAPTAHVVPLYHGGPWLIVIFQAKVFSFLNFYCFLVFRGYSAASFFAM